MLFPIRDDQPTVRTPYVTVALIVVNTLIFLYSQTMGPRGFQVFLATYGFTPGIYFGSAHELTIPGWYYLTPFTSMFLHGGWMHLIGNMLFLWIYGNNIEDFFGPVKFTLFYLVAGLAAVGLYTLPNAGSTVPLVGASGAISGVMGAYLVLHPRAEVTCLLFFFFIQFIVLPAKVVLGIWLVYQLVMTLIGDQSGVAYLAHVGGFVFGWVILWAWVKLSGRGSGPRGGQRVYRMQW
ncbi:MAG: rhomboid family intramembrane serine protease [candidate division Zixibacteria bacterium]|nr:rhomboid family intramembrane serine protease [candidate division Zixibacteria bacterium]